MNITHKTLGRRIISASFAFVLALSTVTASSSLLFAKKADALAFGATELRLSSAVPAAINAGSVATFSVKQVGGLGGDAWTNILTSYAAAKIEATVAEGQVYNCANPSSNVVVIPAGLKVVEGTFCYKGAKAGVNAISLKSTVPQIPVTIVNHTTVNVTVNQVGTPMNLAPGNGTFTNDRGFSMSWDKVANATKYEYQTSNTLNGSALGSLIYQDNSSSSNYSTSGNKIIRGNSGTPDSKYYWQVRAGDAYGNWSSWSAINLVTVDATQPTKPVLAQPSNGSFLNTNEFDFDWNDSTDASPLTYEFQSSQDPSRDGTQVLNGSNIWKSGALPSSMIHSSGAGDGAWFYQVRAKDAAGNYSDWSDIWSVILDTQSPVLTFTGSTPAQGAYVRGIVPIQTIVTDANPGAYNLRIEDGAPAPLSLGLDYILTATSGATNSYSWNTQSGAKAVADGVHKILATTRDKANNVTTITRTVNVDNTKPIVTIKTGTTGNEITTGKNGVFSKISFKLNDPKGGLSKVVLNGHEYTRTNEWNDLNWINITKSHLIEGQNEIYAVDRAGNQSTIVTFIYDTTPPTVTVKDGYVGNLASKLFSNVSFKLYDANKVDKYVLNGQTVDFSDDQYSDANFANIKSKLVQGVNTFVLYDIAGNTKQYDFTYDSVAPVITVATIAPITVGQNAVVTGGVDDPTIAEVEVFVDGVSAGTANVVSGAFDFDLTNLSQGSHNVEVTASDAAGNDATSGIKTATVNAAPTITPASVNGGPATLTAAAAPAVVDNNATAPSNDTNAAVLGESTQNKTASDTKDVLAATKTPDVKSGDAKFFGLNWYWWVPIVAALGGAAWWLLAAWRRRQSEEA